MQENNFLKEKLKLNKNSTFLRLKDTICFAKKIFLAQPSFKKKENRKIYPKCCQKNGEPNPIFIFLLK